MRGRLIYPFVAEIAPLDTAAIEAGGNYDDIYRTVRKVDTDDDGIGETQRAEGTTFLLPAQIEDRAWEELNPSALGNIPEHDMVLIIHFKDLERLSMIDADGTPQIRVGDRLVSIQDRHGNTVQEIKNPPGLFVVEPRITYDLSTTKRNLLIVFLKQRSDSAVRA